MRLHHRNVLVRRRVKHDVGLVSAEDSIHAWGIANVGEKRMNQQGRILPPKLSLDVEEIVLGVLKENDPSR
jgi:hypothetical protein